MLYFQTDFIFSLRELTTIDKQKKQGQQSQQDQQDQQSQQDQQDQQRFVASQYLIEELRKKEKELEDIRERLMKNTKISPVAQPFIPQQFLQHQFQQHSIQQQPLEQQQQPTKSNEKLYLFFL